MASWPKDEADIGMLVEKFGISKLEDVLALVTPDLREEIAPRFGRSS